MQEVIARSTPAECVGLYCAQLFDFAESDNALTRVEAVATSSADLE